MMQHQRFTARRERMSDDLGDAVALAWAEEQRFLRNLSPAEREAPGTHEAWSAKDLVAHLAAAKRRLVQAIDFEFETLEHEEAAVYAAHAADSWADVEAEAARAAADLAARVGRRVEAPWLEGRSLASFVAGYAIRHPLGHLADYHDGRGDRAEAARVRESCDSLLATLPAAVARP
jgi:hypothetical protein